MTTYKDAGVNRDLGNKVSKIFYNASKSTWKNRKGNLGDVIVPFDDFSGIRYADVSQLPEGTVMNLDLDGVGSKIEVAERVKNHRTIAYNLFAMVCDDALVKGAEPVLFGSDLSVNSFKGNLSKVKQLAKGYVDAAKEANVAVINGESAELGSRVQGYGDFNYNWNGTVVWFANKDRILTGYEIKKGDSLVGLKEEGFRSNGLSLVRKIMENTFGENWHEFSWQNSTFGEMVLSQSKIYSRAVVDMFGGWNLEREPKAKVHGVAHITGGGIPEKLGRILKPSGLGAYVDPFEPSDFVKTVQAYGAISNEEAYKTWNMGQGMIIVTPEPEKVMGVALSYKIKSQIIGEVRKKSVIMIKTKGPESYEVLFD